MPDLANVSRPIRSEHEMVCVFLAAWIDFWDSRVRAAFRTADLIEFARPVVEPGDPSISPGDLLVRLMAIDGAGRITL